MPCDLPPVTPPQLEASRQYCSEIKPSDPAEMAKVQAACKAVWDQYHALRADYETCTRNRITEQEKTGR